MRLAGAALLIGAVVAGCSSGNDRSDTSGSGEQLATTLGCVSCHSTDGSKSVGPTWKGLWGSQVHLADGSVVKADDAYVRRSIQQPEAQVVDGYTAVMPDENLATPQVDSLVAYIRSLGR